MGIDDDRADDYFYDGCDHDWVGEVPDPIREAAEAIMTWRQTSPAARRAVDSLTMLPNGSIRAVHNTGDSPLVATIYWSSSDRDWRFLRIDATHPNSGASFPSCAEAIHEAFQALWMRTHPEQEPAR